MKFEHKLLLIFLLIAASTSFTCFELYKAGQVIGCDMISKNLTPPEFSPRCTRLNGKLVFEVTIPLLGVKQYDAETGAPL